MSKNVTPERGLPPGEWIPTTISKPSVGKSVYCFTPSGGTLWLTLNRGGQWVSASRFDPYDAPAYWYREEQPATEHETK